MAKLNFNTYPPLEIKGEIFSIILLIISSTLCVHGQWKDTIQLKETIITLSLIDSFLAKSQSKIPKKISPVQYKSFYTIRVVKATKDTFELKSIVSSYYLKKNINWNTSIHKQYHWHFDLLSGDIDSFRKDEMIKMDLSYFKQLLQVHYIHDLLIRYLRNSTVLEMNTTSDSIILHFRGKLIKDHATEVEINGGFLVFGKEDQKLKRAKLNLSYISFNLKMEYKIKTILQWSFPNFDHSNEVSDLRINTTVFSTELNDVEWEVDQFFSKNKIPIIKKNSMPKTLNTSEFFEFNSLH